MLKCIDEFESNIIITYARDRVNYENHAPLAQLIRTKISLYKKIRWLWIGENFKGWSLKYLFFNSLFDLWHTFHFEKIAIVGDQKCIILMAKIITPFTPAEVRHFKLQEKEIYDSWIRN